MLCFLTVRTLKPGAYDDFRRAWQPTDEEMSHEDMRRFQKIYQLRSLADPDEVISFGLYDGDPSDLERMRNDARFRAARDAQLARMGDHIESVGTDGVFEVVEVIEPAKIAAASGN